MDRVTRDRPSAYVQVEISLGADTKITQAASETGMPEVSIWARHYDVQIRPWENTTTGETELRAAEELAWALLWYAREMRTIVQRNQRQLRGDRPPTVNGQSCLVWCDPETCQADAGGQHRSAPVAAETGSEPPLPAFWLSQTPGEKPVVVLATPKESGATTGPAADGSDNRYTLRQAERMWQQLGRLLDAAEIRTQLNRVTAGAARTTVGWEDQ